MPSAIAVVEGAHVHFVDHRILVPMRIVDPGRLLRGRIRAKGRAWGSRCMAVGSRLQEIVEVAFGAHAPAQAEDVRRCRCRIKRDEVAGPAPQEACAGQQIVRLIGLRRAPARDRRATTPPSPSGRDAGRDSTTTMIRGCRPAGRSSNSIAMRRCRSHGTAASGPIAARCARAGCDSTRVMTWRRLPGRSGSQCLS